MRMRMQLWLALPLLPGSFLFSATLAQQGRVLIAAILLFIGSGAAIAMIIICRHMVVAARQNGPEFEFETIGITSRPQRRLRRDEIARSEFKPGRRLERGLFVEAPNALAYVGDERLPYLFDLSAELVDEPALARLMPDAIGDWHHHRSVGTRSGA